MGRSPTATSAGPRDAATKLAQHRLSVLELARERGDVAEACRQRGLDRTGFYEWKRRFQTQGFEGLKDFPPIHKGHPQATPPETVARIRALALEHPAFGCNRIEALLALEGVRVSAITIQKILNDHGPGSRHDRWLALEQAKAEKALEITPEQAAFLEKLNPCFRERHVESSAPGELLSAGTVFVGASKGIGRVSLHPVVGTFGSCAVGLPRTSPSSPRRWWCCTTTCCPVSPHLGLPAGAVLTGNGREFCGTETHPYELYLELSGIEHRRTKVRTPRSEPLSAIGPRTMASSFVERFNGTVPDEFFRVTLRETCLRQRRGPPGRPRRLARPRQHRPIPPGLPQPGTAAPRHRHAIRQPRRLRGRSGNRPGPSTSSAAC